MYDSKKYVVIPNDQIIPCLIDKCILFPTCLNKTVIGCSKLVEYVSSLSKDGKYDEVWNYVNSIFKKLQLLEDEQKENGKITVMAHSHKNFFDALTDSNILAEMIGD